MPNKKQGSQFLRLVACLLVAALFTGCGTSEPEVIPMSVVVKTAKGKPINHVLVKFVPQVKELDGSYIATGITGDDGTCELKFSGKEESGVCVCEHKVLVLEAPMPKEVRDNYAANEGASVGQFQRTLKHRPLPKKYGLLVNTPLVVTPSADNDSPYEIILN